MNGVLAALFVLVAGHSGYRPVEMRGAVLDGHSLSLPNAKKRPGSRPTAPRTCPCCLETFWRD